MYIELNWIIFDLMYFLLFLYFGGKETKESTKEKKESTGPFSTL